MIVKEIGLCKKKHGNEWCCQFGKKVDNLIITIFLKSSNRADKDRPTKTHCRDFLIESAALTGLKMDEGGEYIPSLVQLTLEGIVHHEHTLLPESIYNYTHHEVFNATRSTSSSTI